MTPVDISEQWREDWMLVSVVNNVLVTDHTVGQPGFDLPAVHGPCSVAVGQVRDVVWPTSTCGVWPLSRLRLQSVTDRERHCQPVSTL